MAKMMEQMMKDMKIEETDQTKEISGYKCKLVYVTIMGIKSEYWITKEIKEYGKLQEDAKQYVKKLKHNPAFASIANMTDMFDKLQGFAIMTSTEFGGMKTSNKVTKVEEKKLSEDLFSPPKEFAKVEVN